METRERSFVPLYITNLFGVVNDNFLKTLAGFVAISWLPDTRLQSVFMGLTAGALVLPYIVFSPLADRLTVIFEKKRIFRLAKWVELPIMAVAVAGFACHSVPLVVSAVLLMGLQSALYSPAKYALVRDVGGEARISTGMGGMEGVTFLAVLLGTLAASCVSDCLAADPDSKIAYWGLFGFAGLGLVSSYAIRAEETRSRAVHAIDPVRYLRRAHRLAAKQEGLNAVIVSLSVFWWAAAMLQMGLLVYGRQVLGLDATRTGMILAGAAVGIVAGQVTAGFLDRRRPLLVATLGTGWLAAVLLGILYFARPGGIPFAVLLAMLSFDLGLYKLPFDTEIQRTAKGPKLNTMLAYFNQVSFLFMLAASGCYALLSWLCGPAAFLLLLAFAFAVAPPLFVLSHRRLLCLTGRWIFSRRYAIAVTGREVIRPGGTYLVLPNHPAVVDPMLVTSEMFDVPLRPLVDEAYLANPLSGFFLRRFGAVSVPDLRRHPGREGAVAARALDGVVTDALAAGRSVIFYPSGHIWRGPVPREEIGTRQLAHRVCGALPPGVRVIAVRTTGLWGSIWSRKGRRDSPPFFATLLRSVLLWCGVLITRRRRAVAMHWEDVTDRVRAWSVLPRAEFNRALEAWYDAENEG